ncbi:isoprenyl transferase [Persicobacter psychrovividus]|uniref:Isoprenyl transferase n=1 Tax=Persicobacter psychrovividus TaxID=387638 RepID=A0ABM7VBE7_9BACT|nr:isoprenyl transferase [Persicobacter psychrovividus]
MKEHINPNNIPQHIAVIMDGNGRWAKKQGAARIFGHRNALKAVRDTVEGCIDIGVQHLTLYTFSTENWNRPKLEVDALMQLLVTTIRKETPDLHKNNVRICTIGDFSALPKNCQKEMQEAIDQTKNNTGLTLNLALSYSGREELCQAMKKIAQGIEKGLIKSEQITEEFIGANLYTAALPDPELLIRTSGEQRISNFLLWQIAYTELHITDTLWPDFRRKHLFEAIIAYQQRERRFGKISEQLQAQNS